MSESDFLVEIPVLLRTKFGDLGRLLSFFVPQCIFL